MYKRQGVVVPVLCLLFRDEEIGGGAGFRLQSTGGFVEYWRVWSQILSHNAGSLMFGVAAFSQLLGFSLWQGALSRTRHSEAFPHTAAIAWPVPGGVVSSS